MPLHSAAMKPVRMPTQAEYAARGLRITLVGASATGKTHVFEKLDAMRTQTHNLRLYEHPSVQASDVLGQLNHLETLLAGTQKLPDPLAHVYLVWYFPSNRWEEMDRVFVQQLSQLCEVIVVVAKSDQRQLCVEPQSGRSEVDNMCTAIREDFPNIEVVVCGDPSLSHAMWSPATSSQGYSTRHSAVRSGTKMSTGNHESAEEGSGAVSMSNERLPFGYEDLLDASLKLVPALHERAIVRVELERKREENWRFLIKVAAIVLCSGVALVWAGKSSS